MAKANWGNCIPFHIDSGELDDQTQKQAFILGVEWGAAEAKLHLAQEAGETEPIGFQIHRANEDRIKKLFEHYGRPPHTQEINDDWLQLEG